MKISLLRRGSVALVAVTLAASGLAVAQAQMQSRTTSPSVQLAPPDADGNKIVGWGADSSGKYHTVESASPKDDPFVSVEASNDNGVVLGLTQSGKVTVAYDPSTTGQPSYAARILPGSLDNKKIIALDSNANNAAAVTADGAVIAWGQKKIINNAPALHNAKAVAIAGDGALALRGNGTVVSWGAASNPIVSVPAGLNSVTAIAAGRGGPGAAAALALKQDGSLVGWGSDPTISTIPAALNGKEVVSIEIRDRAMALTAAGDVVQWGNSPFVGTSKKFAAISAYNSDSGLGVDLNGNIALWCGTDNPWCPSLTNIPDSAKNAPVVAIDTGWQFNVAVVNASSGEPTAVVNKTAPSITPTTTPKVGVELTADPGTWTPSDATFTYQWLRGTDEIADATDATYTPTADDVGKKLSVKVAGAADGLDSASKSSPETDAVGENPFEVKSESKIKGDPVVGVTLEGVSATFSLTPDLVLTDWLVNGVLITTPEPSKLKLTDDLIGSYISFRTAGLKMSPSPTKAQSDSDEIGPVAAAPTAVVNKTAPSITPTTTPKVGVELTADPGTWTPSDATLTYQWLRGTDEIEDATDATYTPTADDVGKKLSVKVAGAADGLDDASATSAKTAAVKNVELAELTKSIISGTPKIGETLTGNPATFTDDSATLSYQWYAGDDKIDGETGKALKLTDVTLVGKTISFETIATRGDGADNNASSKSAATDKVQPEDTPIVVSKKAKASGTAKVGETLTGTPATFTGTPTPTVTNQWLADGKAITGATGTTFKLTKDQVGKNITFKSTATNDNGELSSVSDPIGPVLAKLAESKKPTIKGTAEVGQTLTGTPAEFTDTSSDVKVTNEWLADGKAIKDATGTTLKLTKDQLGAKITYRSSATRGDDKATSTSTSSATKAVVKADDGSGDGDGNGNGDGSDEGNGNGDGSGDGGSTTPPSETPDNSAADEDKIKIIPSGVLAPGQKIEIVVGKDYAGQKVTGWVFSDPFKLGTFKVNANGRIALTLPADVPLGNRRIGVYDAKGDLIGWQSVKIAKPTAGGVSVTPVSGSAGLPDTGGPSIALAPIGLLITLAGGAMILVSRRRREV